MKKKLNILKNKWKFFYKVINNIYKVIKMIIFQMNLKKVYKIDKKENNYY